MGFLERLKVSMIRASAQSGNPAKRDRQVQFRAASTLCSGQAGDMDPVLKTAARIDGRDSATAVGMALEQAGVTDEEPAHTGTALESDMDAVLAALRKRRETDERR